MRRENSGVKETAPTRALLVAAIVAILLPTAQPAQGAETGSSPALVNAVPVQLAGSAEVDGLVVRLEELLTGVGAVVKVVRVATTDPAAALATESATGIAPPPGWWWHGARPRCGWRPRGAPVSSSASWR